MAEITVIVPVYQVERYLHRCICSVLSQTFNNYELVLVDDGSTDRCGIICDEYAEKEAHVQVIHQKNGGLSAARNAGINWVFENSNSQWIIFVDSDDWLHPQYLEFLYKSAKINGTRISVCDYYATNEMIQGKELFFSAHVLDWESFFVEHNDCAVVAWNKLYSRELFSDYRFPEGKIHEDEFLTYKLLAKAGKIAFVPEKLYYYFKNNEGITGKRFSLRRLDAVDALEERISYVLPLGKKELVGFCVASFVNKCRSLTDELNNADWIDTDIRIGKKLELRSRARKILARYGIRYVPVKKYTESYDFAFPVFTNILRFIYRIIGKR